MEVSCTNGTQDSASHLTVNECSKVPKQSLAAKDELKCETLCVLAEMWYKYCFTNSAVWWKMRSKIPCDALLALANIVPTTVGVLRTGRKTQLVRACRAEPHVEKCLLALRLWLYNELKWCEQEAHTNRRRKDLRNNDPDPRWSYSPATREATTTKMEKTFVCVCVCGSTLAVPWQRVTAELRKRHREAV